MRIGNANTYTYTHRYGHGYSHRHRDGYSYTHGYSHANSDANSCGNRDPDSYLRRSRHLATGPVSASGSLCLPSRPRHG
jgi:hypothetical protein